MILVVNFTIRRLRLHNGTWERIIHEDLKDKQMKQLQLNGNWGDAMMTTGY